MGYFSNGSEGEMYESQFCEHCAHQTNCAVWEAHLEHNYSECNNKESILHVLIPRNEDGSNGKCRMFLPSN